MGKTCGLRLGLSGATPLDPRYLRGSPLKRWQSRPARCHLDWCAKIIAAALLNRWDSCFYKDDAPEFPNIRRGRWSGDVRHRFPYVGADVPSARGRPHGGRPYGVARSLTGGRVGLTPPVEKGPGSPSPPHTLRARRRERYTIGILGWLRQPKIHLSRNFRRQFRRNRGGNFVQLYST